MGVGADGLPGAKKAGVNNGPSAPQAVIISDSQVVMRDGLVQERPETTILAVMCLVARRRSMAHQKPSDVARKLVIYSQFLPITAGENSRFILYDQRVWNYSGSPTCDLPTIWGSIRSGVVSLRRIARIIRLRFSRERCSAIGVQDSIK